VLSSVLGVAAVQRISIYADDVALFIKPTAQDLDFVRAALGAFVEASGLHVNYRKSSAIVIRGDLEDKQRVANLLQCELAEFPCKYLRLQLAIKSLTRADWQPMLDQVRHHVPAWQRGMIHRSGRLILVQSVISGRPFDHLMVMDALAWVFEEITKWMRSFFWAGKEKVNRGQCLVA